MTYQDFIKSKTRKLKPVGFQPRCKNELAFGFQNAIVEFNVRCGRSAVFAECGLGKTLIELMWAEEVCRQTGGNVIHHCPVGVRSQTKREAEKFAIGVDVQIVNEPSEVVEGGVSLVNYEKLHKFEGVGFVGVVLDESSILKGFTSKTKRLLCERYADCRYRLAGTATPAPNDHMEIGNHAEFLGVMPSNEMLSRWFVNDTMKAGGYRLRKHAQTDFWDWVASWAVCLEKPSDIGYSDDGYELPPLNEHVHYLECELQPDEGFLFATGGTSATTLHKEKRQTAGDRAAQAAELVYSNDRPWVVWCDTNYEADELKQRIPDAVDVRGSDSDKSKEDNLQKFSTGDVRVIITKPTIAGFGLNWQHCSDVVFVGLSYSYEQFYQAVRRSWRFGQQRPVEVHIVTTAGEESAARAVKRKQNEHATMKTSMATAMRGRSMAIKEELQRSRYNPAQEMEIPQWLK